MSRQTRSKSVSGKGNAKKKTSKRVKSDKDLQTCINHNQITPRYIINQRYQLSDTHHSFVEICKHPSFNMALVDGPAGTSKTYLSTYVALELLQRQQVDQIVYIRSIVESASRSMGTLPGEAEEKFFPWSLPLYDKLNELLTPQEISSLMYSETIRCIPVNYVRGLTFKECAVIVDESQNLTEAELVTILTRFGDNSVYFFTGDTMQADIGSKSGFKKIFDVFNAPECEKQGIFSFKFTELEIVRSEILKFIISRLNMKS